MFNNEVIKLIVENNLGKENIIGIGRSTLHLVCLRRTYAINVHVFVALVTSRIKNWKLFEVRSKIFVLKYNISVSI